MKTRYVVAGSVILVFSIIVFAGIQEAKAFASAGVHSELNADVGPNPIVSQPTPSQAAIYGMSQEIAIWSKLVELATLASGAISIIVLGYGLVSRDWPDSVIRARS